MATTLPRGRQLEAPARDARSRRARFVLPVFVAASILHLELVLRAQAGTAFFNGGLLYTTLFTGVAALLVYVLASLFTGVARTVVVGFCVGAITLVFMSQLLYLDIFRTYFSVFSAARGGQVAEFTDVILVKIGENLGPLAVMAVPLLIFLVLPAKISRVRYRFSWVERGVAVVLAAVLHAVALVGMASGGTGHPDAGDLYHRINEPVASVNRLGLLTTMRLDVQRTLLGFEPELAPPPAALAPKPPEEEPTEGPSATSATEPSAASPGVEEPAAAPVVHGENAMGIDFDALAAEAGDDGLKNLAQYFGSLEPTKKNDHTGMFEGYNLIFITAEAYSHYAVDEELTPTLYQMTHEGFTFTDFYNPVWGVSTSDGEYVATTGLIPKGGVWSMLKSGDNSMPFAMGNQLSRLGYVTKAYHDHTYDYYGRDVSHPNLGYDYKGVGNGLEIAQTWPESDLEMIDVTTDEYVHDEPFHTYYMTVSGHLMYNFGGNFIAAKNRDLVKDLPYTEAGKAYLAGQIELDRALELLLERLDEAGVADRTLIVLSADHYPYGLEKDEIDDLAGHEVDGEFELHKSSLIIYAKGMEHEVVDEPVSSLDILPTVSNLMGLEFDSRLLMGRDVFSGADPLVIFSDRSYITDKGRYNSVTGELTLGDGVQVPDDYRQLVSDEIDRKFYYSAQILDRDYYGLVVDR